MLKLAKARIFASSSAAMARFLCSIEYERAIGESQPPIRARLDTRIQALSLEPSWALSCTTYSSAVEVPIWVGLSS